MHSKDLNPLLNAVAFAARAHRHQIRKDGVTPYFSHPFRVCLILQHVFGVTDVKALEAAILHDTVEDTTTDCDDIIEQFGADVAQFVAALTKDKRLPDADREARYAEGLAQAGWQVQVCKMADIYDNLLDSKALPTEKRKRSIARSKFYLDAIAPHLRSEARQAFHAVSELLALAERDS